MFRCLNMYKVRLYRGWGYGGAEMNCLAVGIGHPIIGGVIDGSVYCWLAQTGCQDTSLRLGRLWTMAPNWGWSTGEVETDMGSSISPTRDRISTVGVGWGRTFALKRRKSNIAGTGGHLAETLGY